MDKRIFELQEKLNDKEYIPRMAYRRNSTVYTLVCYVNNITGCYISSNYSPILVFIERGRLYMEENKREELEIYYQLVKEYFEVLEETLKFNQAE